MNRFETNGRLLFYCEGVDDPTKDHDAYISAEDAGQHNLIGSLCKNGMHKPALDLDFPANIQKDSCVHMYPPDEGFDVNELSSTLRALGLITEEDAVVWIPSFNWMTINFCVSVSLVGSSTPSHYHLYLDKEMSQVDYRKLIEVFVDCGILQQGILRRFNTSGQTFLRPPGHIKPPNCVGSGGLEEEPEEVRADYRIVYYDADPFKTDKIAVAAYVEYTDEKGRPVGDATLHASLLRVDKDRLGGDTGLFLLNGVLGSNYFQEWLDMDKLHESCGPHFSLGVKDHCFGTSDVKCADMIKKIMNNMNVRSKFS